MNDSFFDPKAEAFYAFLRGELPADDPQVSAEEAAIAKSLRTLAEDIQADAQFKADLQERLAETAQAIKLGLARQPHPAHKSPSLVRAFAWFVAAVVLVLGLAWAIRNALPNPPTTAPVVLPDQTLTARPGEATPLPAQETSLPTHTPVATPTSQPNIYTSPMFQGVDLVLQAEFPQSPAQVAVFEQLPQDPLTIETVRSLASQLGIEDLVYQKPAEPGETTYIVTDGVSRVTFLNSPQKFYYLARPVSPYFDTQDLLPFSEQIRQAEAFLNAHNLLDFPYNVESPPLGISTVNFLQLLDGYPVRYNLHQALGILVQLDGQSEVRSIDYNLGNFQSLGSFPIRTAQEAWKMVSGNNESRAGIQTGSISRQIFSDRQIWQREYPMGRRIELFGYPEVLQPVEPGISPFVSFNGLPVDEAQVEFIQSAGSNQLIQAWGQIQPGEKGQPMLTIEGWQDSPFAVQLLEGVITRLNGGAHLVTAGQNLRVPDLPTNFPEVVHATFEGVILEQPEPTLEWWTIAIGAQGGGGGGGGSNWAELNLSPTPGSPLPTATPALPQVQLGQRLDGEHGTPFVTIHQYDDGSSEIEVSLFLEPSASYPEGLTLNLEGPGLAGIEAHHQLLITIFGSITDASDSTPRFNLERYEPVYPGIALQAWLGTVEWVTLEGQQAILFTAQNGEQYVLGSSINQTPENMGIASGEPVVVEGAAYPDQAFGGYPLISSSIAYSAQGLNDPSQIKQRMMSPNVIQEPAPNAPRKRSVVEKIELVYLANDIQSAPSSPESPPLYVQPVWRFSGHDANGDPFEILVQALADEYLK